MIIERTDPERLKPLASIWRKLYCLDSMQPTPNYWGKTDTQHLDSGYCLDRYSLIEVCDANRPVQT